ncbi:hypothetical protein [Deinococcus hohokamensis]|uniref:Winged helix-turn-helix domain-containing protein n=1 Tax=Deinococcus hohokamensis TaxID=309883 RepID=A0ABV9IDG6_9DEIO
MMPHRSAPALPRAEHLRQLRKVYGPLSPAFVAEELDCTLQQATQFLYGAQMAEHCWVRLCDLAWVSGQEEAQVLAWVKDHHLQTSTSGPRRAPNVTFLHLADATRYLQGHTLPSAHPAWAALPRWTAAHLQRQPTVIRKRGTPASDLDWQLARKAAWPMTVERLAEAVYRSRSPQALRQTRRLLRAWEAQGRVVCFARGLYDLVRPVLLLDPALYGRSVLPKASIQGLRDQHPEVGHWPSTSLAAAWRAYSRLYGSPLLPVLSRREPTFLEYLMVRQLHPAESALQLDARYEALCQETAFYRLGTALPAPEAPATPEVSVANLEAGLIDFKALVDATRQKLQRGVRQQQAARSHP